MKLRLDGHLADAATLARIAPGASLGGLSEDDTARIAFHEAAYGRTRIEVGGEIAFTGDMPPLDLIREAASDVMAEPSPESAARRLPILLRRAHARLAARAAAPRDRSGEVDTLSRARRYDDFYAIDEVSLRHETYAGGRSAPMDRAVFIGYDAAIVLPYDVAADRVLVVEQFRMGPFGRDDPDPWLAEPVAGIVDPGESAETTAIREAEEEAGLSIERLVPIGDGYYSPGATSGFHHHYIGLCAIPAEPRIGGLDEEGEDIKAIPMPAAELFELLDAGQVRNVSLMLCAYALRTMREALRAG